MPIRRNHLRKSFTVVDNAIFKSGLSPNAMLVLLYLLSKPDHWNLNVNDIRASLGLGLSLIYRVLGELQQAGFAEFARDGDGKTVWTVSESRVTQPHIQNQHEALDPHVQIECEGGPHIQNPHVQIERVVVITERAVNTESTRSRAEEKKPRAKIQHKAPIEPKFVIPDFIDGKTWIDFVANRKILKKPMTDPAIERMVKRLTKMHADGVDVNEQIEESIRSGWSDVYPPKNGNRPTRNDDAFEKARRMMK